MRIDSVRYVLLLVTLGACAVYIDLGGADIITDNEGQRAAPPAEMLRTGDFIIPHVNGVDYLSKPPLLYWATAAVYHFSGTISAFTARLVPATCALALVLTLFMLLRRETDERIAFLAAVSLLSAPYFIDRARMAELEAPLMWMVFLAIHFARRAWGVSANETSLAHIVASGVCLGAAILLKGPVPLLFLAPALVAHLVTTGSVSGRAVSIGTRWSLAVLAIEVVLKSASYLASQADFQHMSRILGYPVALIMAVVAWLTIAWRFGPTTRARVLGQTIAIVLVGIAVAVPWAGAVLYRQGWDYVQHLLDAEVVTRTYTASAINSGSPFYYVSALPLMLAPWGFLLPLHASKTQWRSQPTLYRFSVLMGWQSVLLFSLIAGKEYEYVLPGVPFLLIATAHIADGIPGLVSRWESVWSKLWLRGFLVIIPIIAMGAAVYAVFLKVDAVILAIACAAALITVSVGLLGRKHRNLSVVRLAVMSVLVVMTTWVIRGHQNTGERSFRSISETCAALTRAGYTVETAHMTWPHVYPALAFYAQTTIPVREDINVVTQKLNAEEPYFYLLRERDLAGLPQDVNPAFRTPLQGPLTSKRVVLIGNRPLSNCGL